MHHTEPTLLCMIQHLRHTRATPSVGLVSLARLEPRDSAPCTRLQEGHHRLERRIKVNVAMDRSRRLIVLTNVGNICAECPKTFHRTTGDSCHDSTVAAYHKSPDATHATAVPFPSTMQPRALISTRWTSESGAYEHRAFGVGELVHARNSTQGCMTDRLIILSGHGMIEPGPDFCRYALMTPSKLFLSMRITHSVHAW